LSSQTDSQSLMLTNEPLKSRTDRKRATVPKYRYSLFAPARWDASFVTEWLEYYRSIGFEHVYIYCNDDDPLQSLLYLMPYLVKNDPFITLLHYPFKGHIWWMWKDYWTRMKTETEWIAFFDIDEYLNLKAHKTIHNFVQAMPADADSFYFNWCFFGNNGHLELPTGSILETYTRRQAGVDRNTKSMTRTSAIDSDNLKVEFNGLDGFVQPHHGWCRLTAPQIKIYDVLANDISDYYDDFPGVFQRLKSNPNYEHDLHRTAVLHHYAFKSRADAERRAQRGVLGAFGNQSTWRNLDANGQLDAFLATLNAYEDRSLADFWRTHLAKRLEDTALVKSAIGRLVSQGRPTLQSSSVPNDHRGLEAISAGAVSGVFMGEATSLTAEEQAAWWQVDLMYNRTITEVRIFASVEGPNRERLRHFTLAVSDDGGPWRNINTRSGPDAIGGIDGGYYAIVFQEPVAGRYVRISQDEHGVLALDQVQIFARVERDLTHHLLTERAIERH
jgi:hypothetical protein